MIYDPVRVAPERCRLICHPLSAGLKPGGATLPCGWRGDSWEGLCWVLGGDAVSGVGAPGWEQGDLCRASPCLSFPCSIGIAMCHGETCAPGHRDLAQLLHVWLGPSIFPPFFPPFCSEGRSSQG